jgi:hypothetical protein
VTENRQASCALRALTLCDGQQLELPDRALTGCACARLAYAEEHLSPRAVADAAEELYRLIDRTEQNPSLPLG